MGLYSLIDSGLSDLGIRHIEVSLVSEGTTLEAKQEDTKENMFFHIVL